MPFIRPPAAPAGRPTLLCATLLALLPPTAGAQDGPGPGGETPSAAPQTSLQRVEISGRQSATDLRRAARVAKQIYGREELDQYGDTNALDVMRRLPGVTIGSDGARMRGLGSGYTQILINGDPMPQGFALDQLSPSQIERIEVLKAPTADQSAQAIAGTINIILRDAPRRSQRDLRLGLSDGRDRPAGHANLVLGESRGGVAVSLPMSLFEWRRENHVAYRRRAPGTDGATALAEQTADQQVWGWGWNMAPRLNWKQDDQSFTAAAFLQKGHWNNRSAFDNHILAGNPVLDDDQDNHGTWQNRRLNLTWSNRFDPDQSIELRGGVNQSRWTYDVTNLQQRREVQRAVGGGDDDSLTQSGKYSHLLGDAHGVTAGWDLEWRERADRRVVTRQGQVVLPDFDGQPFDARLRRQAFFVQDEWEISPQWQLYLGLRHERIETESGGSVAPAVRQGSSVLSPLTHLTWKLDPKGRDMVRASLTRSYKAAPLGLLLGRPALSSQYTDVTAPNTELAPDRIGNPDLRPELATGLDVAFEKYLPGGSMWSVGVFHRRIEDVVRNVTTLRSVSWATVPRYVVQPQNFSTATTSGIELEVKGRAAELMPWLVERTSPLNLRGSLNLYRSRVKVLPGPDNRLDDQQPWTATLGFDRRVTGLPVTVGGSLSINPAYDTQLTLDQTRRRSRTHALDLYALWVLRQGLSARLAVAQGSQPFGPSNGALTTLLANGDYSRIDRRTGPQVNFTLDMRL